MFDFLFRRGKKAIAEVNPSPPTSEITDVDHRCAKGKHEFDDPPPINWKACGVIITVQKRHVTCQRPGCGYITIQTRDRLEFKWNAPFGPWEDFKAGIDCES